MQDKIKAAIEHARKMGAKPNARGEWVVNIDGIVHRAWVMIFATRDGQDEKYFSSIEPN